MEHTFSISWGMRAASLSLRVDCFDDVDANRLDKRAKREGEGDWRGCLAGRRARVEEHGDQPA